MNEAARLKRANSQKLPLACNPQPTLSAVLRSSCDGDCIEFDTAVQYLLSEEDVE
jgi:hypothetical protein